MERTKKKIGIRELRTSPKKSKAKKLPTHDQFLKWCEKIWPYDETVAYCGLSSFYVTSPSDPFNYCAYMHDCYYMFRDIHRRDKKFADTIFNDCMKELVSSGHAPKWRQRLYYFMVRTPIGWLAWNI